MSVHNMNNAPNVPKPVVLIVMDGVGVAPPGPSNAVTLANTPNLDKYWPLYPHTYLEASGVHVGLPPNTDGNSEVGHMALGAGKIIFQDLPRIDNAITNKSFFINPELKGVFAHAQKNNSNVHMMGLIGSGKVHSSMDHVKALIELAVQEKFDPDRLFIHMFTDGRDSPPEAANEYVEMIDSECIRKRMGRIASLVGRAYAMDRDERWERIKMAYDLLTAGKGHVAIDIKKMIMDNYRQGKTDEYLDPVVRLVNSDDKPVIITDNDAIIFFNFRTDRAREITRAFIQPEFAGFSRRKLENLYFVGMTEYEPNLLEHIAFPEEPIEKPLSWVLSSHQKKQIHIGESEKFAHVTYFFNGEKREAFPGETWMEVPSPREVPTYDLKPEMSQRWVTDVLIEKLDKGAYDFALVNFASPDMVAHTGVIEAAIKGIEVMDECIGRVVDKVLSMKGTVLITADHGNAEEMVDLQTGEPDTKHSTNQVPFILIQEGISARELIVGNLADVAPTVLAVMNIEKPAEMTGRNLLA